MIFFDKTYILILIATIFLGIGATAKGYFNVFFFTQVYADYNTEFSILNIFVSIGGGIPASLIGGFLGDYYESEKGGKRLYMKGYITGFGVFIACVFIPSCYLISINFWVSILSLYFITLTS